MKNRIPAIFILTALLFSLFSGCTPKAQPVSRTRILFDTVVTLTVYDKAGEGALDGAFSLAEYYDNLFSTTVETSDIARVNSAQGVPTEVHPETIELLTLALSYAEKSDGAFDPTVGALTDLWDFSGENDTVPDAEVIASAAKTVDYRAVKIDEAEGTVTLQNPEARLDLGGIAKGYIADRLKEYFLDQGVKNAIINLGGNVLTVGTKPDGSDFTVGVQYPFEPTGTPITTLRVADSSLVSSGVYERYFYDGDTLYHHILDTKTGYPVRNSLLGVTILSEKSVDGDALSTIAFCLGLEDGTAFIESLDGIEAIFITEDNALHPTSGVALPD